MQDQPQAASPRSAEHPYPSPAVGWYATGILAFLYWLSILDRFIISLLVDPIKRDLGITDVQFGILHGFAFFITFALFGLLAGSLADRFSRRWMIFASVSIWSLATAACGMAQQYWQLLVARVGVGAGEAGLNPSATSMLADLFPRDKLTSAMAVYAIGATVGSGTAYLFGGLIVDMVSQIEVLSVPIIGELRSWQAVFFIVGIPGIFLSLIIFTVPEPVRRNRAAISKRSSITADIFGSYRDLFSFISPRRRFFLSHYVGFALASTIVGGAGAWYPAHMIRTFGWSPSQVGLALGVCLLAAGVIGKLMCGHFVDRMYRRGRRDAQFRWYAVCLLLATPVGIIATVSANPWVFLGGLTLFLMLLSPLPAVANTALNLATPNELRGAGIAFYSLCAGFLGVGGGPIIVAALSDYFFDSTIGLGLAATVGIFCPLAAIVLMLGCRPMREVVQEAES
ncbi:MAG: MFS transporter [Bacteroidales bacterium]|nr:MFS transporter [Bacteroidales bacterium]